MDKLDFKIIEKQGYKTVTILVNDEDIIEKFKKYEIPFAEKEN